MGFWFHLIYYLVSAAFHSFDWFHLHLGHKFCNTYVKTDVIYTTALKCLLKQQKSQTIRHNIRLGCEYMQTNLHCNVMDTAHCRDLKVKCGKSYLRSLADIRLDFLANASSPQSLSAFLLPRTDVPGSMSTSSLMTAFLENENNTLEASLV